MAASTRCPPGGPVPRPRRTAAGAGGADRTAPALPAPRQRRAAWHDAVDRLRLASPTGPTRRLRHGRHVAPDIGHHKSHGRRGRATPEAGGTGHALLPAAVSLVFQRPRRIHTGVALPGRSHVRVCRPAFMVAPVRMSDIWRLVVLAGQVSSVCVRPFPEDRLVTSQERAGSAARAVSTVRWRRVPPPPFRRDSCAARTRRSSDGEPPRPGGRPRGTRRRDARRRSRRGAVPVTPRGAAVPACPLPPPGRGPRHPWHRPARRRRPRATRKALPLVGSSPAGGRCPAAHRRSGRPRSLRRAAR